MEEIGSRKRSRIDTSDINFTSAEVKRIKEDLLENFDEGEFYLENDELESFMKSFQDEISTTRTEAVAPVESTSVSGDSQPELGFLLEASDNELGLPPLSIDSGGKTKLVGVAAAEWVGLSDGELWRFDRDFPSFDRLDFEGIDDRNYYNDEYLVLDGLFDYSDMIFGRSDLTRRPQTLPAK